MLRGLAGGRSFRRSPSRHPKEGHEKAPPGWSKLKELKELPDLLKWLDDGFGL